MVHHHLKKLGITKSKLVVNGKSSMTQEKMTGKGWEIYESERTFEENLEIFKTVRQLFDLENPKSAPIFESFRTTAKRQDL